ncbi:hypothetical protein ACFP3T_05280 [Lactiplantibacillus dongliensis]|uniref:Uncharacterized protein n=1 Tax=Lactiplantibacillus dongliensis TaxID=2559919 RepID=A0ABW1R6N8_9LACO|nr:hypothetical protein [Lactiplantibacillus dongliensis]
MQKDESLKNENQEENHVWSGFEDMVPAFVAMFGDIDNNLINEYLKITKIGLKSYNERVENAKKVIELNIKITDTQKNIAHSNASKATIANTYFMHSLMVLIDNKTIFPDGLTKENKEKYKEYIKTNIENYISNMIHYVNNPDNR